MKYNEYSWFVGPNMISITDDKGETYTCDNTHPKFKEAYMETLEGNFDEAIELISFKEVLVSFSKGKLKFIDGVVTYDGIEINGPLIDEIINLVYKGDKSFEKLIKFLDNIMLLPTHKNIMRLYEYLKHHKLRITEDGEFITFKAIRRDHYDYYSQSIDNSVGNVIEVPRWEVDDMDDNVCSNGLHVGAIEYVRQFGSDDGIIAICSVNPKDVVSIPTDYNNTKCRVCKYKVVGHIDTKVFRDRFDFLIDNSDVNSDVIDIMMDEVLEYIGVND